MLQELINGKLISQYTLYVGHITQEYKQGKASLQSTQPLQYEKWTKHTPHT